MTRPEITAIPLGDFQTNCHVVRIPGSDACWIVDAGFGPQPLIEHVERAGLEPEAILLTHAHADHVAGLDAVRSRWPVPVWLHEAERGFCSDPMLNLAAAMCLNVSVAEPDRWLRGGETLELAGTKWRVLHAPGHSPGSCVFLHDDSGTAIVGDTLFAGSIGRIDFPTSDPEAMRRTILETLMGLPDATTIYPGHGPATTIGRERASNPWVRQGF